MGATRVPTHIALLRGINVGGHKLIKMAALQTHFAAWGASHVRTYIQSGNVVFDHREAKSTALRGSLEKYLAAKLGYAIPVLVKTVSEFVTIAKAHPYAESLPEFGKHMYVCFFGRAPDAQAIAGIQPYITDDEKLTIKGDAGYAYYAHGLGRAKLTSAVIERKLGTATVRNWNTINALLELAAQ